MRVHQLGHGLIPGDAVSHHILEIDRRLRGWGFEPHVFAGYVAPECRNLAQSDDHFRPFLGQADDVLLYHYSIYDPNYRLFQAFQGRKALIYHNITPPHFFARWDRSLEAQCDAGRWVLGQLHDCDLALGVSDFNRRELVALGFAPERTGLLPILMTQQSFEGVAANETLRARLDDGAVVKILSVGRLVPNKAIEDLLRIFYVYHGAINTDSHLYLVGSRYLPAYDEQIDALVVALGLQDRVTMTGLVPLADLKTYYQAADLYLHASHHEGFCVPLLESMYFGLPILARKAAAVPETLGPAGVLYSHLGYEEVAEMAQLLIRDAALRRRVIDGQRRRLEAFAPARAEARLREALDRLGVPLPAGGGGQGNG